MGLFDFIPTIDEIVNFWECRLSGHKWIEDVNGHIYCKECGKRHDSLKKRRAR